MSHLAARRALACAQNDPFIRRHVALAAFALVWAGVQADERELVHHLDPLILEALAQDRLDAQVSALVLRYLGALNVAQRRMLTATRKRLEAEVGQ